MRDDWEVKHFLDRTTDNVERFYSYKRRPCKRVPLNTKLAEQLAGYALIEKDLRSVDIWLQEIAKRHVEHPKQKDEQFLHSDDRATYNLIKGLFVAAVTFYGKCFSQAEGRRVKLERAQLDERYRDIHDEVISYRHNFTAHSGAAKLEKVDIVLVLPKKEGIAPRVYKELWQPDLAWPSPEDEATFPKLAEHARLLVINRMNTIEDKILTQEVLPKGFDYWKRQ